MGAAQGKRTSGGRGLLGGLLGFRRAGSAGEVGEDAGEDACDVVVGDDQEEAGDQEQADDHGGGLDGGAGGFAAEFFDDEEDDVPAVDDGDGEEVDDGEVDGDQAQEEEVVRPAASGNGGAGVDDADGSAEVFGFDAALKESQEGDVGLLDELAGFGQSDGGGFAEGFAGDADFVRLEGECGGECPVGSGEGGAGGASRVRGKVSVSPGPRLTTKPSWAVVD